jgi:hypothetical protein
MVIPTNIENILRRHRHLIMSAAVPVSLLLCMAQQWSLEVQSLWHSPAQISASSLQLVSFFEEGKAVGHNLSKKQM